MFKRYFLAIMIFTFLYPIHILANETWSEVEDADTCFATWTKTAGEKPGPESFYGEQQCESGYSYTFDLTVYTIKGNDGVTMIFVERRGSSDNNECNYSGVLSDDNTITGQYYCTNAIRGNGWSATISSGSASSSKSPASSFPVISSSKHNNNNHGSGSDWLDRNMGYLFFGTTGAVIIAGTAAVPFILCCGGGTVISAIGSVVGPISLASMTYAGKIILTGNSEDPEAMQGLMQGSENA